MITIHVGSKRKTFAIHKALICNRSQFFSKVFNSSFKEGTEGVMYLPEDDPQAFGALVNWMYRDQLPPFPTTQFSDNKTGCDVYIRSLLPLFQLSEKLCINAVTNQMMDIIQDFHFKQSRIYNCKDLKKIYGNTHQGSKLRDYAVLMILRKTALGTYTDHAKDVALEHLVPLVQSEPEFARNFVEDKIWGSVPENDRSRLKEGFWSVFFSIPMRNQWFVTLVLKLRMSKRHRIGRHVSLLVEHCLSVLLASLRIGLLLQRGVTPNYLRQVLVLEDEGCSMGPEGIFITHWELGDFPCDGESAYQFGGLIYISYNQASFNRR
jgi:hypothetical protein